MTERVQKVLALAMALDPSERTQVVTHLLESLKAEHDPKIEQAWSTEIANRVEELDSGRVQPVPWSVAWQQIKSRVPTP